MELHRKGIFVARPMQPCRDRSDLGAKITRPRAATNLQPHLGPSSRGICISKSNQAESKQAPTSRHQPRENNVDQKVGVNEIRENWRTCGDSKDSTKPTTRRTIRRCTPASIREKGRRQARIRKYEREKRMDSIIDGAGRRIADPPSVDVARKTSSNSCFLLPNFGRTSSRTYAEAEDAGTKEKRSTGGRGGLFLSRVISSRVRR